jgi:hypothetical protein
MTAAHSTGLLTGMQDNHGSEDGEGLTKDLDYLELTLPSRSSNELEAFLVTLPGFEKVVNNACTENPHSHGVKSSKEYHFKAEVLQTFLFLSG